MDFEPLRNIYYKNQKYNLIETTFHTGTIKKKLHTII